MSLVTGLTKLCYSVYVSETLDQMRLQPVFCTSLYAFKITDLPLERGKGKVKNFVRWDELHCSVGQEVFCLLT